MQINIHEKSGKGITSLRIDHAGETIYISAGSYHSAAIVNRDEMFKETNEFIATLSRDTQDALWEIYKQLRDYFSSDDLRSSYFVRGEIEKRVIEIYELVKYPQLFDWIGRARLLIPSDVNEKFEEFSDRGRNYRNRTYIRSDYLELQAMTLGLRFIVPVWGLYVQTVAGVNGNAYKESEAVKLLEKAGVDKWPPFIRMYEYIEASVEKETTMTMVMAGLSSEEVPRLLMSMALVRKISIGPLNTNSDRDSNVRSLFNYVKFTHLRMDSRFQTVTGIVTAKRSRGIDKNDEDNSSVWDDLSHTSEITEGDRQLFEVYSRNVENIVRQTKCDVPISRVQQCISICSRDELRQIHLFQKAIIFWVIRAITPEARDILLKTTLFRLMGITQAVLDHWGFHELAVLVAGELFVSDEGEMYMPSEPRNKITKQQMEILDAQYPYYRQETKRQEPGKRSNVAVIAIDTVVDEMSGKAWKTHAPRDIVEKIPMLHQLGHFYISGDIKRQLADMIIHVNNIISGGK